MLDRNFVLTILNYDPETGIFTRTFSKNKKYQAKQAGNINVRNKAVYIYIDGHQYLAHRLAFLIMTGSFPPNLVDHVNGNPSDNRWSNLRLATRGQNQQNRKINSNNSTGYTGVLKSGNRFQAVIKFNNKKYHLGSYATAEDAYAAYLLKKAELHTFQPTPRENMAILKLEIKVNDTWTEISKAEFNKNPLELQQSEVLRITFSNGKVIEVENEGEQNG